MLRTPAPLNGTLGVTLSLVNPKYQSLIASCVALLWIAGCSDPKSASDATDVSSSTDTNKLFTTDTWIGQWNGPEGTFLRIAGAKGQYAITISNLDGPHNYRGTAVNELILFARNGVDESIRASNGADTGMKWLAEKSNCLTVRSGEGYCRD